MAGAAATAGPAGHRAGPAPRARRTRGAGGRAPRRGGAARSTTPTRTSCWAAVRVGPGPGGRPAGRAGRPACGRAGAARSRTAPPAGGYRLENLFRVLVARPELTRLTRPTGVRIPGLEEALAELPVGLHAEPGEPGPAQVQRHLRGGDPAAVGVDEQRRAVVGREPEGRPAFAAAGRGPATPGPSRGSARRARRADAGVDQWPGHPVLPGDDRLLQEVPAQLVEVRVGLAPNVSTKPACAATPPLISAEAWWSSRTISARVTPSTADTAS